MIVVIVGAVDGVRSKVMMLCGLMKRICLRFGCGVHIRLIRIRVIVECGSKGRMTDNWFEAV